MTYGSIVRRATPSSMPVNMRVMMADEQPMYGLVFTSSSHTLKFASTKKSKP